MNNNIPLNPPIAIKATGVYDPAIIMKIIMWSIFFNALFTLGEILNEWYTVLALYKRIILIMKIIYAIRSSFVA